MNLTKLYSVYRKWLHVEDTNRIDVVLAVALSQKITDGIPLWLILVGASGDMKSVQLNSLIGGNSYLLHNLTSKTLVNGYRNKAKFPDLAPRLDKKILLIPDMAQILKLPPNEKAELWGQLRDLYDGFAGKHSGMGSTKSYQNLKVTLIAASTPAIDAQILVHQDLGTRELIYRTEGNENKNLLMDTCFLNEDNDAQARQELKEATFHFLNLATIQREDKIKPEILECIKSMAHYVTLMRATAEFDNYTNELRNFVYPEEPTRIVKQLKRLFVCLKSLDKDYPDWKALNILWHVAKSSAFPVRIKVFDFLIQNKGKEFSTTQVAEGLYVGKGTARRDLAVLESLKLISCRRQQMSTYTDRFYEYWTLKPSGNIIHLYNIPLKIKKFNTLYNISSDGLGKDASRTDEDLEVS